MYGRIISLGDNDGDLPPKCWQTSGISFNDNRISRDLLEFKDHFYFPKSNRI